MNALPSIIPFGPDLILSLQRRAKRKAYAMGDLIAENGTRPQEVAIFMHGAVKVSLGCDANDTLLYYLTPEVTQVLGFSKLWPTPCSLNITAQRPTALLWVSCQDYSELSIKHSALRAALLRANAIAGQRCLETLHNMIREPIATRMIHYLQSKAQFLQADVIPLCRDEMAKDLNVSKETISRAVKRLESRKMVKRGLKTIALVMPNDRSMAPPLA